ncbi:MAG: tRNA pseudouridine(13) synthase TruD [Candidatus Hydrothermales bacterium]
MKFKVFPEDFFVEEVLKEGVLKEKGIFKLYKAKKVFLESFYLKKLIERAFNVKISLAGLKDKKSVSIFYFTAKGNLPNFIKFKDFSAELVGFSDKELSGSDIEKNNFKITMREINEEELESLIEVIEDLKVNGFPNYFDIQRLSYEPASLFFPYILKRDYKEAIKVHLLSLSPESRKNLRRFKKILKRSFYEPAKLIYFAPSKKEREIINKLIKGKYIEILKSIEPEILKIYFEKFSSYLWNKCASKFLSKGKISGKVGFKLKIKNVYLFVPEKINESAKRIVESSLFPVLGTDKLVSHPEFEEILIKELRKENIDYPLNIPDFLRNFSYKSYPRKLWIYPQNLSYDYKDKNLILNFSLDPGAYATLFIKLLIKKLKLCILRRKNKNGNDCKNYS